MTTLQEYLNQKYPTKEDKDLIELITVISNDELNRRRLGLKFMKRWVSEGGILQEEFRKVETIMVIPKDLDLDCKDLNLTDYPNVEEIILEDYKLTSIGFLNTLPNPEKLEELIIHGNNIELTNIEIFSRFNNLKTLMIGTSMSLDEKRNHFYGSLKSYQNLTKLENVCIEATDVNEGLEYLPTGLVSNQKIKTRRYILTTTILSNAPLTV